MIFTPFAFMAETGGVGPVDPDLALFLSATGITDPTTVSALGTLVSDLKGNTTAGGGTFWAALDIIYPFAGTTATSQQYNLKDTTQYTLTLNGTLSHTSNGIGFNGDINNYAQTGWLASNNTNNWAGSDGLIIGLYRQTAYGGTSSAWGTRSTANVRLMEFSFGGAGYYDAPEPLRMNNGAWISEGSYILNMDNNVGADTATNWVYKNGVQSGTRSAALSTTRTVANAPDVEIYLGRRSDCCPFNGFLSSWFLGQVLSVSTPDDVATLDGFFNTYQTTMGRNLY